MTLIIYIVAYNWIFVLGMMGLLKHYEGFTIYNPCELLHVYHVHCSELRRFDRMSFKASDPPWSVPYLGTAPPTKLLQYATKSVHKRKWWLNMDCLGKLMCRLGVVSLHLRMNLCETKACWDRLRWISSIYDDLHLYAQRAHDIFSNK